MSINTVHIVPAEEQYAPPDQIIELAVTGDETGQLVHQETPDCPTCGGVGAQSGAHTDRVHDCPECHGTGRKKGAAQ